MLTTWGNDGPNDTGERRGGAVVKAFKPDGSRWYSRSWGELVEAWAREAVSVRSAPAVPPLDVVVLDVVVTQGGVAKLMSAVERGRARVAELEAKTLQLCDAHPERPELRALREKLAGLQSRVCRLRRSQPAPDLDLNRHERRAFAKGKIPTRVQPGRPTVAGRKHHEGAASRRVRR